MDAYRRSVRRRRLPTALLILLSAAVSAAGQDVGLRLSGEASADAVAGIADPFESRGPRSSTYSAATAFRLDGRGGIAGSGKVEASALVRLLYGDAAARARSLAAASLAGAVGGGDAEKLAAFVLGAEGPVLVPELKKLYFAVYGEAADVSVGRMVVNYGRGTAFSPVDVFSAVDAGDPAAAFGRAGTDAVRVSVPAGDLGGVDLVSSLSASIEATTFGGRAFGDLSGWDWGASAFRAGRTAAGGEALLVGLDLKGDLELGLCAEALVRLPIRDGLPVTSGAAWQAMAGADYSLSNEWFFDAEYQFSSSGGEAPAAGTFRAAHTAFASVSWKPDEVLAVDARAVANLGDGAWTANLASSLGLARGAALTAYVSYRDGDVEGRGTGSAPASAAFGVRLSSKF